MGKFCKGCGAELAPHIKFCSNCGAAAEQSVQPYTASAASLCTGCGAQLSQTARFCRRCGAPRAEPEVKAQETLPADIAELPTLRKADTPQPPITRVSAPTAAVISSTPVCTACGAQLSQAVRFCRRCGAPTAAETQDIKPLNKPESPQLNKTKEPRQPDQPAAAPKAQVFPESLSGITAVKQKVEAAAPLLGGMAAPAQGDMNFDFVPPAALSDLQGVTASVTKTIGPIKLLLGGITQLIQGFKGAIKDRRKLIPALIFAVVWVVLTLLPLLGVMLPGGKYLSWLTFAQGGTRGGIPGVLGGVFGKGLLVSVFMGLFRKNNELKKPGSTWGEMTRLLSTRKGEAGALTAGIGIALLGYNLMTGDNSLQNSMIGIVAAVASLRSLTARESFMRSLFTAFAQKFTKGRGVPGTVPRRFMVGMAAGFAAAVPLSAIGVPWLGYALGTTICIVGAILGIAGRPAQPKGVAL